MITLKQTTMSILLVLAIGLTTWSFNLATHEQTKVAVHKPHQPDSRMEKVIATVINKEGKMTLKLFTPCMIHYADDDTTDITTPEVALYRQNPEPWHINAEFAKTAQGIAEIQLLRNVVIHHLADKQDPDTAMKTTELTVFPNKKLIATHAPVTIVQPDAIIHAIGLLADLNDGTVKLLSQARGEYVPNS